MEQSPPPNRPWLDDHFIAQVLPTLVERPLFGRKKIRFGPLLLVKAQMYETGAILGRARAGQVDTLLKITFDKWDDTIPDQAEYHLSLIQKNPGGAYVDLIWELSFAKIPPEHRLQVLARNAKHEEDYDQSILILRLMFMWGIRFGAKLPDETARLYRKVHESADTGPRPAVPVLRLKAEPQPQIITLEQWEQALLEETAIFVPTYYPELMVLLRL